MTPIMNPTLLFSPKLPPSLQHKHSLSRTPTQITCLNDSPQQQNDKDTSLKNALSGIVSSQLDELLNKQENRELLGNLEEATKRVEIAKEKLADIQRKQIQNTRIKDYISRLQSKDSEIAECQREILEAKSKFEEAELSLSLNANGTQNESEDVNRDEERWESVKAASISAVVGTLAGLPISFTQVSTTSELILPVVTTFVSCALFGVTFRYAIRGDLDNFQLKSGAAAAFGVVKGLAMLSRGPPLELSTESLLDHAFSGALFVSQNVFIFLFAAVGIDFCFKFGLLSTFPVRRSSSRSISR